jgi:hypothetical protein
LKRKERENLNKMGKLNAEGAKIKAKKCMSS